MTLVGVSEQDKRDRVAGILNEHGAEFVGFYGVFAWTSLAGTRR